MFRGPRPTDAEFEELKRLSDIQTQEVIRSTCLEMGWDPDKVSAHVSHQGGCYCACPDGPCQHIWDGKEYTEETEGGGFMSSVTCSRCGVPAIYHDMRVGP
jgi:predicted nucleic-acid-binding Zn-ribbon protein